MDKQNLISYLQKSVWVPAQTQYALHLLKI